MVPALASIIVATNACRGKWNRHYVALSDNFFTHVPFFNFCKKMQKMKIDYVNCPMGKVLFDCPALPHGVHQG